MSLRDATPDDVPVVAELIRALAAYERLEHEVDFDEADLRHHLFGPEQVPRVLLATEGDEGDGEEVVGFALWFPTFSTFLGTTGIWLEDLFVRPEHRGRGHGRALIEALRARTDGRVEWAVLDWNTPSIEFYDRLGARPHAGWITYRWHPPA